MTLRVAVLTPGYPPQAGGIEVAVASIVPRLVPYGITTEVFTQVPYRSSAARFETAPGVVIRRFTSWTGSRRFPIAPLLWSDLYKHRGRFDVVYAHGFHAIPANAALAIGLPFIFQPYYHGGGHTLMAKVLHVAYSPLAKRLIYRACRIICISNSEAALLTDRYPNTASKTLVIHSGVPYDEILKAEPYTKVTPILLVSSRLEEYKQVHRIIECLPLVEFDVELIITGTGTRVAALQRLATSLGVSRRVRFLGHILTADLRRWQRTADAIISMSRHESFGLTVAETMAAGAYAVLSDIPAHREVSDIAGRRAWYVPVDCNNEQLAAAITAVLTRSSSENAIPLFSSWDEVARRVAGLLHEVTFARTS